MRLLNLRIRGAIGLKPYGEEISIDFTNFDSGPLAVVGLNGAGKTTILENLHPWPQLISRSGSLAKHFCLKDSLRELKFEYGGQRYFSKILIDGQRDKVEVYLYRNDEPLNDGKVTTYKETVNRLFGSPEVFFKSIFSSQNGTKISELTPGAKKEFFLGLLGLDRYERYTAHCKEQGAALASDLARITGKRESLLQIAEGNEQKLLERPNIEERMSTLKKEAEKSQKELDLLRKELEDLKGKAAQQEQIEKRLDELRSDQKALVDEILLWQTNRDDSLADIKGSINNIDNEITNLQDNLLETDTIRIKADRLKELQTEFEKLSTAKSTIQELELKKNNIQAQINADKAELHNEITIKKNKFESLKKEIDRIREDRKATVELARIKLQEAEKTASELQAVPCKDTPEFVASCPLISSARDAQDKIETFNNDLLRAQEILKTDIPEEGERDKLSIEIDKDEHEYKRIHPKDEDLSEIEKRIEGVDFDADRFDQVRQDIAVLKKTDWQELLNQLDKAEITIEERRKKIEDLKTQRHQIIDDYGKRIEGAGTKQKVLASKIIELEKEVEEDLEPEINGKETQIRLLQDRLNNQRSELASCKADLDSLDKLQGEFDKQQAELKSLSEEKAKIDSDISDWKLLERAFGKNGLQALELDAAGPEISNIATEVIQEFGRGWSVDIRTVRASADAKKDVETFEIIVSRSEGVQSFDDLSGGEQVWVEEAIRKAVTIYLVKHAGRDYQTLFQDEADGALDPERAEAFLNTTIKAHELTGVHHTIIITQRESIWDRIPQRIHLDPDNGVIRIVA